MWHAFAKCRLVTLREAKPVGRLEANSYCGSAWGAVCNLFAIPAGGLVLHEWQFLWREWQLLPLEDPHAVAAIAPDGETLRTVPELTPWGRELLGRLLSELAAHPPKGEGDWQQFGAGCPVRLYVYGVRLYRADFLGGTEFAELLQVRRRTFVIVRGDGEGCRAEVTCNPAEFLAKLPEAAREVRKQARKALRRLEAQGQGV